MSKKKADENGSKVAKKKADENGSKASKEKADENGSKVAKKKADENGSKVFNKKAGRMFLLRKIFQLIKQRSEWQLVGEDPKEHVLKLMHKRKKRTNGEKEEHFQLTKKREDF